MTKQVDARVRMTTEEYEVLESLGKAMAGREGKFNRSAVVREFIPSDNFLQAMIIYSKNFRATTEDADLIGDALYGGLTTILVDLMKNTGLTISAQIEVETEGLTGKAQREAIAKLFVKWSKAWSKRIAGYSMERIEVPCGGDSTYGINYVACKDDKSDYYDDPEAIEALETKIKKCIKAKFDFVRELMGEGDGTAVASKENIGWLREQLKDGIVTVSEDINSVSDYIGRCD